MKVNVYLHPTVRRKYKDRIIQIGEFIVMYSQRETFCFK